LQLLKSRKRGKVPQKQQKWQNNKTLGEIVASKKNVGLLFNILEVSDVLAA